MEDLRKRSRFNSEQYELGVLCLNKHDFEGTGKSLRSKKHRHCLECKREQWRRGQSTEVVKAKNRAKYHLKGRKLTPEQKQRRAERARWRSAQSTPTEEQRRRKAIWQYEYKKRKMKTDPVFHTVEMIRKRLRESVVRYGNGKKIGTSSSFGINFKAIVEHLGPCPGNRKEYEIDHIIPLCSFDMTKKEQVLLAFAPENHQWLPKHENRKKGGKIA